MENKFEKLNNEMWNEVVKEYFPKNINEIGQYSKAKKLAIKFQDADFLPTKDILNIFNNIISK